MMVCTEPLPNERVPMTVADEDFDQLVRDWGRAAEVIANATADVTHDGVLKLYTLARLIRVGGIGTRELKIIEVIRWDMRRLAAH
jgi:limonene-1,2-epoxide hydrolase